MQYFNEFPVINYSITGNPTDTKEIMRVCQKVGATSVLTSKSCKTGTSVKDLIS